MTLRSLLLSCVNPVLQKVLKEVVVIKDISTRVMEAIHNHQGEEHVKKVVQTSSRIKLLQADFDKLKSTTLQEYNLDNFAVGRD